MIALGLSSFQANGRSGHFTTSWACLNGIVHQDPPPVHRAMPTFNILESASPELRTWLLANGETQSVPTETVLIKEGERQPSPMVLLEGRLNVTTSHKQQGQERLSSLTPGCLVGEMSWLEKRPAVASVTSSGHCTVLRLSIKQLEWLHRQQPALAAQLHRVIAQKLALQIQAQNVWAHRLQINHGPVEALRKVLTLFASLQEQDVFKLAGLGQLHRLQPQTLLLNQGDEVDALYVVLSGEAEIVFSLDGKPEVVGTSRRGELLGEMSLLLSDQKGASAGVRSSQGMDLLKRARRLIAELDRIPFGRAVLSGAGGMLSRRSRSAAEPSADHPQSTGWGHDRFSDVDQLGAITEPPTFRLALPVVPKRGAARHELECRQPPLLAFSAFSHHLGRVLVGLQWRPGFRFDALGTKCCLPRSA